MFSAAHNLPELKKTVPAMQVHAIETRGKGIALQFEHPTIAGTTVGGWMNRADKIPVVSPVAQVPQIV